MNNIEIFGPDDESAEGFVFDNLGKDSRSASEAVEFFKDLKEYFSEDEAMELTEYYYKIAPEIEARPRSLLTDLS